MSSNTHTARWRFAALLSTAITLGLGLGAWRQAQARRADPVRLPLEPGVRAQAEATQASGLGEAPSSREQHGALPLLAELARTSARSEQVQLVTALGETEDEAALAPLMELATRAEDEVAQAALISIAKLGGARAREFLERRFGEAREAELPQLAAALATLGGSEAREILVKSARSTRSGASDAALGALATLDAVDVRALMLTELRGTAPSAAVAYFSDCVEPGALPALEQLARSAETELSAQVVTALVAQGPSAHATLRALLRADAETADAVLGVAKDVLGLRAVLRAASIERLRAGAVTTGALFDYLSQDLSQEARAALVEAARDSGSSASAINALAERGDPASLAALSTLSRDAEPEIADAALCAQFRKPDSRARATLLAVSADGTRAAAAAALASIDAPEAERALDELRASADSGERRQAAQLLGSFGSRDAERDLDALARDSDYGVVAASLRALDRIGASSTLRALATQQNIPDSTREYAAALLER